MTIKSLLLGSAAALVAVSTSNAADAIVAPEPEAMEYVKVCDTYGAGYYYIPGTETCLSINGYVRSDFNYSKLNSDSDGAASFTYRARVNFDTRTETELGTLRGLIRLQADGGNNATAASEFEVNELDQVTRVKTTVSNTNGDAAVYIDQALIQLGGFSVGYTDSAWVNNTWGLNGVNSDGNFGYHQTNLIGYEYAQDGLSAGAFLEFGFSDNVNVAVFDTATNTLTAESYDQSWRNPNVVARVKYDAAWGSVWALGAYDNNVDAFAGKLGAEINLDAVTEGAAFKIQGSYDFGKDNVTTKYVDGQDWDFLVGYSQPIGDTLAAAIGYTASDEFANGDIVGNLTWTPVTGFSVAGEVVYHLNEDARGVDTLVRFKRSF